MPEVLRVEGISAGYDERAVIKGLSFALNNGEVLAVIGPNGSGKTTLIKAVLGLLPLKAGKVVLFGGRRFGRVGRPVAYIPQRMELDRTFPISLREMLGLGGGGGGADKYIEMLELGALLSRKVGELSGGEMQRALLAYALIKEPGLLLMDEPTSWIDMKGAGCVLCLMEEFKEKGIATIIVSHDFSVVRSAATHVLGMGHEDVFFEPADSPALEGKINSLFGTTHHAEGTCLPICVNRKGTPP